VFRPEASPLKGLTSAYGQPEARLPHSFTRAFLRFEKSQDFCSAENLIYLAVTSAFRLDNLSCEREGAMTLSLTMTRRGAVSCEEAEEAAFEVRRQQAAAEAGRSRQAALEHAAQEAKVLTARRT